MMAANYLEKGGIAMRKKRSLNLLIARAEMAIRGYFWAEGEGGMEPEKSFLEILKRNDPGKARRKREKV